MSHDYDRYIAVHRMNVMSGYYWLKDNLPEVIDICPDDIDLDDQMRRHDASKLNRDEYIPYDAYFYGGEKTPEVIKEFNHAWLLHIHRNPHHWQYWILMHDAPIADTILPMPNNYVIEMLCDWWSFSWSRDNLCEIFDWYEKRKEHIRLNPDTRKTVEDILKKIREKLEEIDKESV